MQSTLTFQEWLESRFRPIVGGETPPDNQDPDPADGGDNDPDPNLDAGDTDPDPDPDPDPAGGNGDVDDADLEEMERIRRERDEARTRLANAEAAARKAKQEARKAREEAAKKGGNWEQVAREREAELQEANERAQTAEREKVEAQEALDSFRREVRVTRIATLLGYHDPQDAIAQLANKPEATAEDKTCMRALRQLAQEKPYLVDARKARGRAMGDGGGQAGLTWEQVQAMPEEEVIRRWDEVQPVLSRGPAG
jgi:hypothetical protein